MPLSFGVLLGMTIILIGAILFFATNKQRIAKLTMSTGVVIALLTLALIILAVTSPM